MRKYNVDVTLTIEAENRQEAQNLVEEIITENLLSTLGWQKDGDKSLILAWEIEEVWDILTEEEMDDEDLYQAINDLRPD